MMASVVPPGRTHIDINTRRGSHRRNNYGFLSSYAELVVGIGLGLLLATIFFWLCSNVILFQTLQLDLSSNDGEHLRDIQHDDKPTTTTTNGLDTVSSTDISASYAVRERNGFMTVDGHFDSVDMFKLEDAFYEDFLPSLYGGNFVRVKFDMWKSGTADIDVKYLQHETCYNQPKIPIEDVPIPERNEIPKIIHFVHVSNNFVQNTVNSVPESVQFNIDRWQRLHPDYEIKIWTNREVHDLLLTSNYYPTKNYDGWLPRSLLLDHLNDVSGAPIEQSVLSWMSDLLRYYILYHFGGIYLDTDEVAVRPIDIEALLSNAKFDDRRPKAFTVCETPFEYPSGWDDTSTSWSICGQAGSGVIVSVPGHPALRDTLSNVYKYSQSALCLMKLGIRTDYHVDIVGPPVWGAVCRKKHADSVAILKSGTFYPCVYNERASCDYHNYTSVPGIYGMHGYAHSWK